MGCIYAICLEHFVLGCYRTSNRCRDTNDMCQARPKPKAEVGFGTFPTKFRFQNIFGGKRPCQGHIFSATKRKQSLFGRFPSEILSPKRRKCCKTFWPRSTSFFFASQPISIPDIARNVQCRCWLCCWSVRPWHHLFVMNPTVPFWVISCRFKTLGPGWSSITSPLVLRPPSRISTLVLCRHLLTNCTQTGSFPAYLQTSQ